jgi:hypothetical protein
VHPKANVYEIRANAKHSTIDKTYSEQRGERRAPMNFSTSETAQRSNKHKECCYTHKTNCYIRDAIKNELSQYDKKANQVRLCLFLPRVERLSESAAVQVGIAFTPLTSMGTDAAGMKPAVAGVKF